MALSFKLLPTTEFQAQRVEVIYGPRNRPTNVTTNFTVRDAWLQPISGHEQGLLGDGYRDKVVYKMYCSTKVRPAEEGTNNKADRITAVWDGETFQADVIKVQPWQNNAFLNHNLAMIVKVNER